MNNLTDVNYKDTIGSNNLIILYFWADWCSPCKKFSPIFEEVAYENNLFFGKIDSDANPIASAEFEVESIPTVLVIEDGAVVKRIIGAMPKHQLVKELNQWI